MPTYNRTINCVETELTEVDLAILYPFNRVKVTSSLPVWFVDNVQFGYSTTWEITPPIQGTFTYNVDVYALDEPTQLGTGVITIIVADKYENVDNCCSDNNINIVWLNRQGGRGNFIFSQRKDTGVNAGETKTFISNGIKKFSQVKNVYDTKIVYCTGLTQTMVDFLDTLRYPAIQAWQFNSDGTFTEIIIDPTSFQKYTTKGELLEVQLSFQYAKRLKIQGQ